MIILETERLILRHHRSEDWNDWEAMENPDRFLDEAGSPEQARLLRRGWFLRHWASQEEQAEPVAFWAVVNKADGRYIGHCGGFAIPIEGARAAEEVTELGWFLHPEYWGQGLATEAARAVVAFLRRQGGRRLFIATIHQENQASQRVAEKIGMRYDRDITEQGAVTRLYTLPRE